MDDRTRIRDLLRHLHELRVSPAADAAVAIHQVAIDAVEREIERLGRRLDRHAREGLLPSRAPAWSEFGPT